MLTMIRQCNLEYLLIKVIASVCYMHMTAQCSVHVQQEHSEILFTPRMSHFHCTLLHITLVLMHCCCLVMFFWQLQFHEHITVTTVSVGQCQSPVSSRVAYLSLQWVAKVFVSTLHNYTWDNYLKSRITDLLVYNVLVVSDICIIHEAEMNSKTFAFKIQFHIICSPHLFSLCVWVWVCLCLCVSVCVWLFWLMPLRGSWPCSSWNGEELPSHCR